MKNGELSPLDYDELSRLLGNDYPLNDYSDPNAGLDRLDELTKKVAENMTSKPYITIPAYLDDSANVPYHSGPAVVWSYKGIICKAEITDTAEATYAAQQPRLAKLIDAAMPSTIKNLKLLDVNNGPSPDETTSREETHDDQAIIQAESYKNHTAFYHGTDYEKQATLDHELGHLIHLGGGPVDAKEYAAAAEADRIHTAKEYGLHRGRLNGGFATGELGINNYGMFAETEDFAEAVRLFTKDWRTGTMGWMNSKPLRFAEVYPNRDRLIRQYLGLPAATDADRQTRKAA